MKKSQSKLKTKDIYTIVAERLLEVGTDTKNFYGFSSARRKIYQKKIR